MTAIETSFRRSTSPDYRATAIAAAPDSTTVGGRNSDPVNGISYRAINNDDNINTTGSGNLPIPAIPGPNTGTYVGAASKSN